MRNPAERGNRPTTSRRLRPDAAHGAAQGRTTRTVPVAPKKNNTPIIIGGAVGGLVLLILIIAAASSGSKPAPKPKAKPVAEAVPVVEEKSTVTKQDSGPITFACSGGGQHPEMEKAVTRCPKCDARSRFFWDYKANKFSCFQCKNLIDKAEVRCPDCGGLPNRDPYIKHRPG